MCQCHTMWQSEGDQVAHSEKILLAKKNSYMGYPQTGGGTKKKIARIPPPPGRRAKRIAVVQTTSGRRVTARLEGGRLREQ